MQIKRLTLGPYQARVEERQGISADLHVVAGPLQAGDDVRGIHRLRLLTANARPHAQQAVRRVLKTRSVVWDAAREDIGHRHLDRDGEEIKASENVFARRPARARDAAEIVRVQVDQIEDPFLIELIRIVELPRDDPPAVGKLLNVAVDERLIVEPHFTARGSPGVVALEGSQLVDQPVSLRAVVIREDREILAQYDVAVGSLEVRARDARDGHGLGAAGKLPE